MQLRKIVHPSRVPPPIGEGRSRTRYVDLCSTLATPARSEWVGAFGRFEPPSRSRSVALWKRTIAPTAHPAAWDDKSCLAPANLELVVLPDDDGVTGRGLAEVRRMVRANPRTRTRISIQTEHHHTPTRRLETAFFGVREHFFSQDNGGNMGNWGDWPKYEC